MTTITTARVLAAATIAFAPATGASAQSGKQYLAEDFRVVTTVQGQPDTALISGHAVGTAEKLRIDVTTAGIGSQVSPLNSAGKVGMIISDSGKTITYLDTQNNTYLRVRPADMLQEAQQMGGMTMQFSGTKVTVDSLGAGPIILGHPTVHYRFGTALTMNMSAMGQQQSLQFSSNTEYYYATDIKGALNPFTSLNGSDMVNMFGVTNKDFADKMRAAVARLPKGTPLRASSSASIVAQGETRVTNTQAEVTAVKWVPADDKAFEIPATYKESAMPSMSGTGAGAPPPR